MHKLILLVLLLSTSAQADTFFTEQDKIKHIKAHAIGANFLYLAGYTPTESFLILLAAGIAFEVLEDENTDNEKLRDIKANIIGASTVFVWSIKF